MPDEPTLGEVMRRLDETSRQLGELGRQMAEDRKHYAQTYVRQDVYLAQRQADQAVTADLAGDLKTTEATLGVRVDRLDERLEKTEAARKSGQRFSIGTALTVVVIILTIVGLVLGRGV